MGKTVPFGMKGYTILYSKLFCDHFDHFKCEHVMVIAAQ